MKKLPSITKIYPTAELLPEFMPLWIITDKSEIPKSSLPFHVVNPVKNIFDNNKLK